MNLQRCESFARETQTLLNQVDQLQAALDQNTAHYRIAGTMSNLEQAKKLSDQKKELEGLIERVSGVLFERTNRSSVDSARTLIVDLFACIELAQREFAAWRGNKAEFEFRAGEPDPEFDRAVEERKLEAMKRRYERRIEVASEFIPNKPVVLTP